MIILLAISIYLISGVLAFFCVVGGEFANAQCRFPLLADMHYEQDRRCAFELASIAAKLGPLGLIVPFMGEYPCIHGWRWPKRSNLNA